MQSALFAPPNSTSGEMLLPLLPETRELLETYSVVRAEPQTFRANGYYSIIACNLLETGMLLPTLATTIVDTLEQRDGLWRSMCRFDEGPHVGIGKCDKHLERPFERLRHSVLSLSLQITRTPLGTGCMNCKRGTQHKYWKASTEPSLVGTPRHSRAQK